MSIENCQMCGEVQIDTDLWDDCYEAHVPLSDKNNREWYDVPFALCKNCDTFESVEELHQFIKENTTDYKKVG